MRRWIETGAPNWDVTPTERDFITPDAMLTAIQQHVNSLASFDRPFARYFSITHLYNAGETDEALGAYSRALSKLINSLSWGREVIQPQPIDLAQTLFYIDLRNYEWDVRNAWLKMEAVYHYPNDYGDHETYAPLYETLQQELACEVPFVQVDWFLATASLPPLYHDILDLPDTDRELEEQLDVDVAGNLQNAPGFRVWRAGVNESRVSKNNRVVERHTSRYGAYWKSYDFAGNVGAQNISTHPLSFTHDGGEIIFNLPNGLQAYLIVTNTGTRIDSAPVDIVSNPAAPDPVVHNGLSCIGCHAKGMQAFDDDVRAVIQQHPNPPFDKAQALRLYVEQATMDDWLAEDNQRFRAALEAAGGIFGETEPVERFHQRFGEPLDAAQAASAVGYSTSAFREEIQNENGKLRAFGLQSLLPEDGSMQRDTWTSQFSDVVAALYDSDPPPPPPPPPPGPDPLLAAIRKALGKPQNAQLTSEDMLRLTDLRADRKGIRDLTRLEFATNLERLELQGNAIADLTPLRNLTRLGSLKLGDNLITDVSPLAKLTKVRWLGLNDNRITDLSPLSGLEKLDGLTIRNNPVSDISGLSGMLRLSNLEAWGTRITSLAPLAKLRGLRELGISGGTISDVTPLTGLPVLRELTLESCGISDITSFAKLTGVTHLSLRHNDITDVSPLAGLRNLERLDLHDNEITDFSALEGLREKTSMILSENPGFRSGGPKITGPWLWVLVPGTRLDSQTDFLAQASGGDVTELKVATTGATEGKAVGESRWRAHRLSATGGDNINDMTDSLGWGRGEDIYEHIVYGSILLDAPMEQQTTMFVGSDDAVKVWLNGELVHQALAVIGWTNDYQDFFPVTLKQGKNVLLVAVDNHGHGGFSGFFGFEAGADYSVLSPGARLTYTPYAPRVSVGQSFTLHLSAEEVAGLAGWQFDLKFDPAALSTTQVSEGSLLKTGGASTFFRKGTVDNQAGTITGLSGTRLTAGGITGTGRLVSVTFRVKAVGETRVRVRNLQFGDTTGAIMPATSPTITINVGGQIASTPAWDVNEDGVTNLADLALVSQAMGKPVENPRTDVNGDGVVDGEDFALVAAHIGAGTAAAPSHVALPAGMTLETVEWALNVLHVENTGSAAFRRGIAKLEQFLAMLVPDETLLLANYPNPFNPETWIPYQLAKSADVTVSIYAADGKLVRKLDVGYQPAGAYRIRSRAAYWDGRNALGERVASGVYFYTFTAGDFTATRKMLVVK